jgi:ATP-dependent Clp protease protease subunit
MRTIIDERTKHIAILDVFSKLVQERIIYIDGIIDDDLANGVIAQMLYLNSIDSDKKIDIYINSIGGSILAGLAIYDTAQVIECEINTICIGCAASMGAVLMLMGKERSILKHSRIMFHEASGYNIGKTKDVEVEIKLQKDLQNEIYNIIKEKTQLKNVEDLFKIDTWFTAKEALNEGIITKIL